MYKKKILVAFGTRPEAIKMAPVVHKLAADKHIELRICVTGQHREMLIQVLELFDIKPDFDLRIMTPEQSLNDVTSSILIKMRVVLAEFNPDLILVHGDTATTFAVALAAYYHKVPVGHVEAGLRTGNIFSPWPEEANRKLTAAITTYHFAPTERSERNLLTEGVSKSLICVTGNTVVDALLWSKNKIETDNDLKLSVSRNFPMLKTGARLILVTGHRRESFGRGFERICEALLLLSLKYPDCQIVYPVHLNPKVQEPVLRWLKGSKNIHLILPQNYLHFVYLMMRSHIILTDSGGIQEEAPALGKPVLLMRDTTERPEAVESGTVKIVGTNVDKIVLEASLLLDDPTHYKTISGIKNPYGDGESSEIIKKYILEKIS